MLINNITTSIKSLEKEIDKSFITGQVDINSIGYYNIVTKYIDYLKVRRDLNPIYESKLQKLKHLEKTIKFTCKNICNIKTRTIET